VILIAIHVKSRRPTHVYVYIYIVSGEKQESQAVFPTATGNVGATGRGMEIAKTRDVIGLSHNPETRFTLDRAKLSSSV
jgi:hypothetical protein